MNAWNLKQRMTRWLLRLIAVFALAVTCSAQAAVESVPPIGLWCNPYAVESVRCIYLTASEAAQAIMDSYNELYATQQGMRLLIYDCNDHGICAHTYCSLSTGVCEGGGAFGSMWIPGSFPNCPTPTDNPTVTYVYNATSKMCERDVCPLNSSGTFPNACTCNDGYEPDPNKTSCVPVSKCSIDDLPPITDPDVLAFENNPNTSDTARLTTEMKAALKCLTDGATALGCTPAPSVGSAYRPPAYNQHLIDVWKKWRNELMRNNEPGCAARKAKIQGDFKRHKLLATQPPVPNSRHTRGLAVDVTINLPPANIKTLAKGCGLVRPKPVKDPVHFQFP